MREDIVKIWCFTMCIVSCLSVFLQEQLKGIIIIASVRMWAGGCNLGLPSSSFALQS
jgi:hypothetical protein